MRPRSSATDRDRRRTKLLVLGLAPRIKSRSLIVGKAWVDTGSYAVVRTEGQFAAARPAFKK